jgi:hypothetical protein
MADGFTGLRIAAEATELIRTPRQLEAFARYEHAIDRYMMDWPFAAMCGYDRKTLGPETVAAIAAMHPLASPGATPLRLFPSPEPEVSAALAGEIDIAGHDLLRVALHRADLPEHRGKVVIDATGLSFVDHRGLIRISDYSVARDVTTVVHTRAGSSLAMLAGLIELPRLQVQAA